MSGDLERAGRLERYRGGMTVAEFADRCGIAGATAHTVLKGKLPSTEVAIKVSDALGMDLLWYLTGREPVAANAAAGVDSIVQVPMVDHGFRRAGEAAYPRSLLASLGADPLAVRCMIAKGVSMRPSVPEEAEVLYEEGMREEPIDGRAYVIDVGGRPVIRRLRAQADGSWVESCDNVKFPGGAVVSPSSIVGPVIWVSHRP